MRKLICFVIFGMFFPNVKVNSFIEQDSIFIGDIVNYVIQVELNSGHIPIFPELMSDSDNFDYAGNTIGQNHIVYHLTFWESGLVKIPAIPIQIKENNEIILTINTDSIQVKVYSLLNDEESSIRGIKGMMDINLQSTLEKGLKISAVIIGVIGLFYFWRKRYVRVRKEKRNIYSEPEHIRIIKEIENIETPIPLNIASAETYYLELTRLFREFLSHKFYFKSMEMTTSEIGDYFERKKSIDSDSQEKIIRILNQADLSKFAMHVPKRECLKKDAKDIIDMIKLLQNRKEKSISNIAISAQGETRTRTLSSKTRP